MRPALCHPERKHYSTGLCRPCYDKGRVTPALRGQKRLIDRRYYARHQSEIRARIVSRRKPEVRRAAQLKKLYGLTAERYATLLAAQGGGCAICGKAPNGRTLAVDHDHVTGAIRGLLCSGCNLGMGHLGEHLGEAAAYIRKAV